MVPPGAAPAAVEPTRGSDASDPAVAALCTPLSPADPCGPDLDADDDTDYLNFFAYLETILPISFFNADGKPFDPNVEVEGQPKIDFEGQLATVKRLFGRSRDMRLLLAQARLFILNRNLGGFAVSVAALGRWLETSWDAVHPRPKGDDLNARLRPLSALDKPTVIFPLQYVPLFETPRKGVVTYRAWMVANGQARARPGDPDFDAGAIAEALNEADPAQRAAARRHIALLKAALETIGKAFLMHGAPADLQNLTALVDKIYEFIDPHEAAGAVTARAGESAEGQGPVNADAPPRTPAGPMPTTTAEATEALAAVADYYSRSEPSSPALPLVRQAYQLVGKSFLEVMTALVPSQVDKAVFQIGTDQVFDLPVGKLAALSGVTPVRAPPAGNGGEASGEPAASTPSRYGVESRSQAIALLDQVQQYFRRSEPSSPVPMLCQRARALAERDFMGVLKDVLPKAALKTIGADK